MCVGAILKGLSPNANPSPPRGLQPRRLKAIRVGREGWGVRWEPALWVLCQFLPSLQAAMKRRSGLLVLSLLVPSSLPGQRIPPGCGLQEKGSNLWPSLSWENCLLSHPLRLLPFSRLSQPAIHSHLIPGPGSLESISISRKAPKSPWRPAPSWECWCTLSLDKETEIGKEEAFEVLISWQSQSQETASLSQGWREETGRPNAASPSRAC